MNGTELRREAIYTLGLCLLRLPLLRVLHRQILLSAYEVTDALDWVPELLSLGDCRYSAPIGWEWPCSCLNHHYSDNRDYGRRLLKITGS